MNSSRVIVVSLLLIVSAPDSATASSTESPNDPLSIRLKGTEITSLPKDIMIVTDDPVEMAKKFALRAGGRLSGEGQLVFSNHIAYHFNKPSEILDGRRFKSGDVIYCFYFDSEELRQAFEEKYSLQDMSRLALDGTWRSAKIYIGKERAFVWLLTLVKKEEWACSMHPEVSETKFGKCPICQMALIQKEEYK